MNITLALPSADVQPPTNLQHTTGNFYVRHTWAGGAHTDSYNVSINGVWHNATATANYDDMELSAHVWRLKQRHMAMTQWPNTGRRAASTKTRIETKKTRSVRLGGEEPITRVFSERKKRSKRRYKTY